MRGVSPVACLHLAAQDLTMHKICSPRPLEFIPLGLKLPFKQRLISSELSHSTLGLLQRASTFI